MGLGDVLTGAGRIGREYEADVSRGMLDAARQLANMQALNSLREQEQMAIMRKRMADMPSFDYATLTAKPESPADVVISAAPSATPPARQVAPNVAVTQKPAPALPSTSPPAPVPVHTAMKTDPWVEQNRKEEIARAERGALNAQYGPFAPLVKWFRDIRAEEEAARQAYIAEATGKSVTGAHGLGTRSVVGKIPGGASSPVAQQTTLTQPAAPAQQTTLTQPAAPAQQTTLTQPAAPAQQTTLTQPAAPAQQAAQMNFMHGAPISYIPPQGMLGQQARLMDMQAKQLMHMIQSWKDAGAPAGMYDQVMLAHNKLADLAVNRVALETNNAINLFERGGDPRTAVALLAQVTGGRFGVYQHPQNPELFAIGPQGADPVSLRWMSRQRLANEMRMVSDYKFSQLIWEMQRDMAKKQFEQQGTANVEHIKGQYDVLGKLMEAEANMRKPHVMNTPSGGQVMVTPTPGGGAMVLNPAAPGMNVAGEQLPSRPSIVTVQPNQPLPAQGANTIDRIIVPGYQ